MILSLFYAGTYGITAIEAKQVLWTVAKGKEKLLISLRILSCSARFTYYERVW
jgi:hypothetical protein